MSNTGGMSRTQRLPGVRLGPARERTRSLRCFKGRIQSLLVEALRTLTRRCAIRKLYSLCRPGAPPYWGSRRRLFWTARAAEQRKQRDWALVRSESSALRARPSSRGRTWHALELQQRSCRVARRDPRAAQWSEPARFLPHRSLRTARHHTLGMARRIGSEPLATGAGVSATRVPRRPLWERSVSRLKDGNGGRQRPNHQATRARRTAARRPRRRQRRRPANGRGRPARWPRSCCAGSPSLASRSFAPASGRRPRA